MAEERNTLNDLMPLEMLLANRDNLVGRFIESFTFHWPILCYCAENITFANDDTKRIFLQSLIDKAPKWKLLGKHEKCLDSNLDVRA